MGVAVLKARLAFGGCRRCSSRKVVDRNGTLRLVGSEGSLETFLSSERNSGTMMSRAEFVFKHS